MKKFKVPLLIFSSFLLGGLISFLILQKQIQTTNYYKNTLLANMMGVQEIDAKRITLDNDSFVKLFVCLSFVKTCNPESVLTEIKTNAEQVGKLNEQKQKLEDQLKQINAGTRRDWFWIVR